MSNQPDRRPSPLQFLQNCLWDLRVALAFLTRIPLPIDHARAAENFPRSVWAYPVLGALVGGVGGLLLLGGAGLGLHPLACAVLAMAGQAILTGALHEDGLSDTADGLGGATRERRLDIMRDSRVGTYGVLALIFSVGLRMGGLMSLLGPGIAAATLVASGILSRAVMPVAMAVLPMARAEGLGATAGRPPPAAVYAAAGIGLAGALIILAMAYGAAAPVIVFAGIAGAASVAILAVARFGGYTGDILGALQQAAEIAVILAAAGAAF